MIKFSIFFVFILVFFGCQSEQDEEDVQRAQEIELVFPYDVVESGYVGEIPYLRGQSADPKTHSGFESIQPFECAAVAYAKLGKPILQGKHLPISAFQLENVYENPSVPIHQYVVWINGDRIYCLAFNELAEVVSKRTGLKKP